MQRYLIWWLLFQFSSVSCTLLTTPLHPNKGEPSLIFIKNSCSLWKFQGKRAHIYWMWACIAPFNQSRPSPNLGEIISWFAVEETEVHRDDVICTRFHTQNVAKLRFKPWLPHSHLRPPPAWNLRGVRSGEDPSHMPTETQLTVLDYQGTKQEQMSWDDISRTNVLSPPCETPWCHFPSPHTTTSWAPAHLCALLTTAILTGWCKKKSCLRSFSPNSIHLSKAVASKILL